MRAETASRAPHARKHGTTFAETWTTADHATIVAVGAVLTRNDPIVVSDLLRTGARAVVTSRKALATALGALDRVVQRHAKEHRDDALAAAVALFAFRGGRRRRRRGVRATAARGGHRRQRRAAAAARARRRAPAPASSSLASCSTCASAATISSSPRRSQSIRPGGTLATALLKRYSTEAARTTRRSL